MVRGRNRRRVADGFSLTWDPGEYYPKLTAIPCSMKGKPSLLAAARIRCRAVAQALPRAQPLGLVACLGFGVCVDGDRERI